MFDDEQIAKPAEGVSEQGMGAQAVVLAVRDQLAELVRDLDPKMVDVQVAPGLWDAFDAVEKLSVAGKLMVGQRVDASRVAKHKGFRDTAEYLARRSGRSRREGARQLRASEQLADLPATQAAVRRGEISADQAAAIADAATADPEAERGLLTMAGRVSLKELQDACLRVKAKADPNPERTRKRQHRDRFLRHGRRPDGTFSLYGQGPPEDEGLLQAALRHGIEDRFRAKSGGSDDELTSYDQRAYDALFDILRTHIHEGPFADLTDVGDSDGAGDASHDQAHPSPTDPEQNTGNDVGKNGTGNGANKYTDSGNVATGREPDGAGLAGLPARHGQLPLAGGTESVLAPDPGDPPALPGHLCERCGYPSPTAPRDGNPSTAASRRRKRRRRRPNPTYTTLVRIDIEALNRGRQEGDEVCDMPGLGPVSVPAARALLPASIIRLILTRGQEVAAVVHAGRGPNTAQKMALNWMQPVCTVEGCTSQIVQADHRIDWATTRHTALPELDHLCPHHHRLKTHQGWALVKGTGKRAFVPPDDPRHPRRNRPQADESKGGQNDRRTWSDAA